METGANFHLLRPRFFRQVQFYLAGISFRYRNFFVLPREPEESMEFSPEIRPLGGDHSCFDRVGGDAVLHFAPPSALSPRNRGSYDFTPTEVGCAPKHV